MTFKWLLGSVLAGWFHVAALSAGTISVAEVSDSVRITRMLEKAHALPSEQNKILFFAKGFLGTPYAGGTLETFPVERLVVRIDSVDCTTFAENILALVTSLRASQRSHAGKSDSSAYYSLFKQSLQLIRYRQGELDGYTSRLHYFSDWISDNERKGLVKEVTSLSPYAVRKVDLNFMSEHASLYPFLANDSVALSQMKEVEKRWLDYEMPYIPKEKLNAGKDLLKVQDGDIITFVTNIKGLDVVHVGIACWIGDKLHLLHASSAQKKVVLDTTPLYDYSKNKKSHIGIRVIHVLDN